VTAIRSGEISLEASTVVLASGVATQKLAEMAEVSNPHEGIAGRAGAYPPAAEADRSRSAGAGRHCKQKQDGRVVVGGHIVAGVGRPRRCGPNPARTANAILREACGRIAGASAVWQWSGVTVGYRVMPVDEYPVVGFTDRCPNLYVAAMHSG